MGLQKVGSRVVRAVGAVLAGLSFHAYGEALPESDVKAAFVLNFIRYSEGMQTSGEELRVCSVGASPLEGRLSALTGRATNHGTVTVVAPTTERDWRDCHVLFVGSAERVAPALTSLAHRQVLTVGDSEGFAQAGGMIELKLRAGRVRFVVNHGAVKQAGLRVSSQLLKLSDEVYP